MITVWWCLVVGPICYGLGLRVAAYYYRKAAKQAAAEFMAKAAEIDERITKAGH